MAEKRRVNPCKFCRHAKTKVPRRNGKYQYVCFNPACSQNSSPPATWQPPVMRSLGRFDSLAHHRDEEDPGFEDVVRVLEDFPSLTE